MKNQRVHIRFWILLLFITGGLNRHLFAQFPVNLAAMKSLPQAYQVNPATEPPYNFWIGIPAISGIYVGFENTGFRYKDVIYKTADDSLHVSVDGFLNSLSKNNSFSLEMKTELLAMGFHIRKYYIDIRLSARSSNYINYSKDLMGFLVKLNGQYINEEASFSGTGINASLFNEASLGISRPITEKLYAGIRFKYIGGVFNIYSRKTDVSLYTDEQQAYALTLKSDLEINTCIPEMIDDPDDFINYSFDANNLMDELSGLKNPGYGLDLGIHYTLNRSFNIAASVTDLGFISWTSNTKNYISDENNTSFSFEGIDLYDFFENDSLNFSTQLNKVLDSLEDGMGIITRYDHYTSPLLTRVYISGEYNLTRLDHVGALLRFDLLNNDKRPLLCLNYRHEFGKILELMAGYSVSQNNYLNLGLGFSLKLGFVQMFALMDNAYAIYDPKNFKSCNVMFGMNVCFGDRRRLY